VKNRFQSLPFKCNLQCYSPANSITPIWEYFVEVPEEEADETRWGGLYTLHPADP
jgi:hypothetical protein